MKLPLAILLISGVLLGCTGRQKLDPALQEAIGKVDQHTKPFNPNVIADSAMVKLVFTFNVEQGQIEQKPSKVEYVSGPMPYVPSKGRFKVTTKDKDRNDIATLYIDDPLVLRSCDDPKKPAVSRMEKGIIHIQVRYRPDIAFLELLDEESKKPTPIEVDVLSALKTQEKKR
jgi:hypothetical protein